MSSLPIGTPDLYNGMGITYEEAFGHDPGLLSFVEANILPSLPPSAAVLDLGSGTGKPNAAMISGAGHHVLGIDYSPVMLELARKAVPAATFEQSDILSFETDKTFDAVLASMSLFNFTHAETKRVVQKAAGWVRPGGYLFVVTIEPDCYGQGERDVGEEGEGAKMVKCNFLGNIVEVLLYTEDGWRKLLEGAGFEVVRTKRHFFEPKDCDPEPHYFIVARRKN